MFKKRGFKINELYSQMGFYFQMKKSMGILEIDVRKKEYVKKSVFRAIELVNRILMLIYTNRY